MSVVHSTSRSTSTEVPATKQTKNNKNYALQNGIEILKKKIESMQKQSFCGNKNFPQTTITSIPTIKITTSKNNS